MDSTHVSIDEASGDAWFRVPVGPDTVHVAGQEVLTSGYFDEWTESLAAMEGSSSEAVPSLALSEGIFRSPPVR